MSDVPGLLSLYNLLARASNVSCSKGASAFLSLPTTEDDRLSLAIDGFLPALQNPRLQIPQRILAAFVLNALYVSYDHLNPFHDHLLRIFESERAIAIAASRIKSPLVGPSKESPQDRNGAQAENEQLVWVLWKILQGEDDDLAPYSPNTLSRTTIPEHLRPLHLDAHGCHGPGNGTLFNSRRSPTELSRPTLGFMDPPTSQNSTTLFQTRNPLSISGSSRTPPVPRHPSNRMSSTSELSPFDVTIPESSDIYHQKASEGEESQVNESQQAILKESFKRHSRYKHFPDPHGHISPQAFSNPIHEAQADIGSIPLMSHQHSKVIGDQRQQALLRRLFGESYGQSNPDPLLGETAGTYDRPDMRNQTFANTKTLNESSQVEQQLQHSTLALPCPSTQFDVRQHPIQNYLRNHNNTSENASSLTSVASNTGLNTRPRLDPVSRPYPNALSSQPAALDTPVTAPSFEIFSVDGRVSRPDVTVYDHGLPQQPLIRTNNIMQQAPGFPFAQQKRTPTPTRVSPPTRSPGVIGSGRPSASVSKNDAPVDPNTFASRWSQIGIIGNGRPGSSLFVGDGLLANRGMDASREHESMIPFSVLRMRSMREESEKREHGVIGQPKTDLGDDNGRKGNGQTDGQTGRLLEKLTALSIERKAQVPSREANIASFKSTAQAIGGNWPPSQEAESVPTHAHASTLQQQATPLQPSAIAFHPQPIVTPVFPLDQSITNEANVSSWHPSSILPSVPTTERGQLYQNSENSQPSPFYISRREETSETHSDEKERNELSHAIFLLLSARERVLTLAEQRMLQPHLSTLTQPLSLLRPNDIPPLVAKNTDLAAKLLLLLLDRNDEEAQRIERIVRDASKDDLLHMNHGSSDDALPAAASIDSMAAVNAIQAMVRFVSTCGAPSNSVGSNNVSPFGGREAKEGYLDAIRKLPPTTQSFNLIAKLLRPTHHRGATSEQQDGTPEVRVEILIRTEVLGGFVTGCVRWIEQEEKEGEVHDDRVAIAITSLCRFYSSLLKHGFVSAASEVDTTEMMSFALQFSRFEEARSLYSTLAAART